MIRLEKVFQLPTKGGMYENVKIAVEGEDPLKLLSDIYLILYMDRLVNFHVNGAGDKEKALEIINSIKAIEEEVRGTLYPIPEEDG